MKRFKLLVVGFVLMLLLSPQIYAVKTVQEFGEYLAEECNVTDNINGSSAILGDTVNVLGKTDGISFVLGNTVNLRGASQYLFLLGNVVNIDTTIENDAFILGAVVNVTSNNVLGRDAAILAGEVNLSGTVGRDITIAASTVKIDNAIIRGDIFIDAENIIISGDTSILGELSYYEDSNIDMANTVTVDSVSIMEPPIDEEALSKSMFETKITNTIYSWCAIIVVFLILVFATPVFKKVNKVLVDKFTAGEFFKTAGIGFLVLIAAPFAMLILLCTVIGIPLALLLLVIYIVCIWLSSLFAGYVVVKVIFKNVFKKDIHNALAGIIGLVLIELLGLIPAIGGIITFISLIFGMGAFVCMFKKLPESQVKIVEMAEVNETENKQTSDENQV